ESCEEQLLCAHGGYTDPKNCSQCRCTEGLGGRLCEEPLKTSTKCGGLELNATSNFQILSQNGTGQCNFLITAPAPNKILIEFDEFTFRYQSPCSRNYLEIRYGDDISTTGVRFCLEKPKLLLSKTEHALILYHGLAESQFTIRYKNAQQPPIETTIMLATTNSSILLPTVITTGETVSPEPTRWTTTSTASTLPTIPTAETTTAITTATTQPGTSTNPSTIEPVRHASTITLPALSTISPTFSRIPKRGRTRKRIIVVTNESGQLINKDE
ncbi:Zinc metalloproteinase nas-34, partial [Toxocara canis]